MKILFVAQATSIHTSRWIAQLNDRGWDLHLFDMLGSFPHPELAGVTEYSLLFPRKIPLRRGKPRYGHPFFMRYGWDPFPISVLGYFVRRLFKGRVERLASLIERLRPDVIHSFELQTEGYHLLDAAGRLGGSLGTPWIVNTWGSDIFYFQHFPEHLEKIKALLMRCDYLIPDCVRDVSLARSYGFAGEVPLILPGAGGYRIDDMRQDLAPGQPSSRRIVMLKGYDGWAGRAKQALAALESCADLLAGYEVVVYSASPGMEHTVRETKRRSSINLRILPRSPHGDIVRLFGRARIAVGVNDTDGVPNAMLEAMTMGALPVQSDTQSTAEWIADGQNGILLRSNSPQEIAAGLRRALQDDGLVDRAARANLHLMKERLDIETVRPQVLDMYRKVAAGRLGSRA
jgi:glycosyltransferase involved in cell wall biosynthesis